VNIVVLLFDKMNRSLGVVYQFNFIMCFKIYICSSLCVQGYRVIRIRNTHLKHGLERHFVFKTLIFPETEKTLNKFNTVLFFLTQFILLV